MIGLTKRQTEVLAFVHQFIKEREYSPSLNEIKNHFGFASANAAAKHLALLKDKGYLLAKPHGRRSLGLPTPKVEYMEVEVPLVGKISAGKPLEIFAEIEFIPLPSLTRAWHERIYLLKVQDNSFQDEMLLKDDLLIIETGSKPNPGDTVIATVNQSNILVGRYFCDGEYVKLMSHSMHLQPLIVHIKDISIEGVLISSIRNY